MFNQEWEEVKNAALQGKFPTVIPQDATVIIASNLYKQIKHLPWIKQSDCLEDNKIIITKLSFSQH